MISDTGNRSVLGRITSVTGTASVWVLLALSSTVMAGTNQNGETIVPGIWVDPDGCEHWVFDDGAEGYMTPNVTRDGRPVCRTGNTCAVLRSDQLFATDQFAVSASGTHKLNDFFAKVDAKSFIITGHTDSRASDAYNMALSERRADAVAAIARASGATIFDVRGYGERAPKASNDSAAGRAINRRVEIICVPEG